MNNLVTETAAVLREFNPQLADRWLTDPLRRVDLARAFAAGFVQNEEEDVHPVASLVLRVALSLREEQRTSWELEERLAQ